MEALGHPTRLKVTAKFWRAKGPSVAWVVLSVAGVLWMLHIGGKWRIVALFLLVPSMTVAVITSFGVAYYLVIQALGANPRKDSDARCPMPNRRVLETSPGFIAAVD
jgi:hypothetical protein